jgi:hypothetical protein
VHLATVWFRPTIANADCATVYIVDWPLYMAINIYIIYSIYILYSRFAHIEIIAFSVINEVKCFVSTANSFGIYRFCIDPASAVFRP